MIILAFAAIYIIWGSTYLFNKILLAEIPPFLSAGLRFFTASLVIFGLAKLMKVPFDTSRERVLNSSYAGMWMLAIGNGAMVWGLQFVDSGFTSLLVAAQPLILLIMLYFMEGQKISRRTLFGIVLGVLGIYLLTAEKGLDRPEGFVYGIFAIFFAIIAWGYGSIYVANKDMPRNHFINAGVQMCVAGILLLITSLLFREDWSVLSSVSRLSILSWIYLIIFGSIIAFTAFNYLLKNVSPVMVSTNTYVNPVVALFLGWIVLSEPITIQGIIASVILLLGVFVINTRKRA